MIKNIQIRLKRQQYDKIKNDANLKGFNSLSGYLRYLALHRDDIIENKILDIHEAIIGKEGKKSYKKQLSFHDDG